MLYIVRFLHQTTTPVTYTSALVCCISSVSYIKPQPATTSVLNCRVVYRPFPTSNHNCFSCRPRQCWLYIVRFLHQTTTGSCFPFGLQRLYIVRFLHQTTTKEIDHAVFAELYIVRFLHQTTTILMLPRLRTQLYIVRFLHQTTTVFLQCNARNGCISSVSYIKPQPSPTDDTLVNGCISSVSYIKPQPAWSTMSCRWCCISSVSYIKPQHMKVK